MKKDILAFILLVLLAVVSRFIPHSWNMTAVGAVSMVAGLIIKNKKISFAVPLISLLLSDAVLGFHNAMLFVYLGYLAMTFIAVFLFDQEHKVVHSLFVIMLGSLSFFAISNFGVWYEGILYPRTFSGFMNCYQMALPFFRNELISNIILTPVLVYLSQKILVRINNVA